jgi:hypothetical protein
MNLNGNFALVPWVADMEHGNNCYAEHEMDAREDNTKKDAQKFRDYAAECRRLAQRAADKDRKVLMEIAEAWDACAKDAERKEKSGSESE